MAVRVEGSFSVRAPREAVWTLLFDPQVLIKLMPGCQRLERVADDRFEVAVVVGVGAIKGTFSGTVSIVDQHPPQHYRLIITARGSHGYINGEATIDLTEQGDTTLLAYQGQGRVGGPMASVGQRLLDVTAKTLLDQSFSNLRAEVEARQTTPPEERPGPAQAGASLVWFRMTMALASLSPARWKLAAITGYGGLVTNFLAALAYVGASSMVPGAVIPAVTGMILLLTAATWPVARLLHRRETSLAQGLARGTHLLGEFLLPLSLYLVAYQLLPTTGGDVARSASVAAVITLLYGGSQWRRSFSSRYLVALSLGTLLFLSTVTLSISPVTAALSMGALSLVLGWWESRGDGVRRRHGVLAASTLVVGAIVAYSVTPLTPGLLVFFWLAAGLLFVLARLLRDLPVEGSLLAVVSYSALILSFFQLLTYLTVPREVFWIGTVLCVGILIAVWYGLREERLAPFGPMAYLTSTLLGLGLIGWLFPPSFGTGWSSLQNVFAHPLRFPVGAAWLVPPAPVASVALLLLALLWAGGAVLRRIHPSFSLSVSGLVMTLGLGMITTYLPPLLTAAAVALLVGGATDTFAGVVLACLAMGVAFLLIGPWVSTWYPPVTVRVGGWTTLAFAAVLSFYNAGIAVVTLTGIAGLCLALAVRNKSLSHSVVGLTTLTAAALITAFSSRLPVAPGLILGLFSLLLVGLSRWFFRKDQRAAALFAWLEALAFTLMLGVREFSGGLPSTIVYAVLLGGFLAARPTREGWPVAAASILRPGSLLTHTVTALLHQVLRASLLIPHVFAGLLASELTRVLSLPAPSQAVAFALLAWLYLALDCFYEQRAGPPAPARLLARWSDTFGLLALILGALYAFSGLLSVAAYFLVGGLSLARYRRATPGTGETFAHLAVACPLAAVGLLAAHLGVQLREIYTTLVAVYFGFVLLRQPPLPQDVDASGGLGLPMLSLDQARSLLPGTAASAGLLATAVGYPAGALVATGEMVHLYFLGVGALCLLHLFQARRHPAWTTLTALTLFLTGVVYAVATAQLDVGLITFLLGIGTAIALDVLYAGGGTAPLPRASSPGEM